MSTDPTTDLTSPRSAPDASSPAGQGSFWGLLERFRDKLEERLAAWLGAKRAEIAAEAPETAELTAVLEEVVRRGGKRLRPALLYWSYRACGGESEARVMPAAMAVELLHTYLLVHDDIMDRAETRRGGPAAHLIFRDEHRERRWAGDADHHGESVAILLGDLAHTFANELFAEAAAELPGPALHRGFATMCQEVIAGQYLELTAAQRQGLSEDDLLRVLRLKSGRYSVERPIQLGALLAGESGERYRRLSEFGLALGEAFQLQDDLLGMFGDSERVGKPVGSDLAEGKYTLLIHHTLLRAAPEQAEEVRSALGDGRIGAAAVDRVRGIISSSGARSVVAAMVEKRLRSAAETIAGLELEPEGKRFLVGLIDYLRERES